MIWGGSPTSAYRRARLRCELSQSRYSEPSIFGAELFLISSNGMHKTAALSNSAAKFATHFP